MLVMELRFEIGCDDVEEEDLDPQIRKLCWLWENNLTVSFMHL